MQEDEKRIKEIEQEIETLNKERRELKVKISSEQEDGHTARMLSRVQMKVFFNNVLFIYCSDDEGLSSWGEGNHDKGVRKYMDEVVKIIANRLGNPACYDLKDTRDKNYNDYFWNPYLRVLVFNANSDNWDDTLQDVVDKIKIVKDDGDSDNEE